MAGVLSSADLFRLSRLRGELMAAGTGDRGSMAAVAAPLADIETFIQTESLDLVLANRNTHEQGVLSGATSEIEKACRLFEDQGFSVKKLDVAAAFHSRLIADAADPFAAELEKTSFGDPQITPYSNTSGGAYPANGIEVRQLLAQQLASPVDLSTRLKTCTPQGCGHFLRSDRAHD